MYGRVINGGAQAQKGNGTKKINDKLAGFAEGNKRSVPIANAVLNAFSVRNLSDNSTNNVSAGGKFKTPKVPAKV